MARPSPRAGQKFCLQLLLQLLLTRGESRYVTLKSILPTSRPRQFRVLTRVTSRFSPCLSRSVTARPNDGGPAHTWNDARSSPFSLSSPKLPESNNQASSGYTSIPRYTAHSQEWPSLYPENNPRSGQNACRNHRLPPDISSGKEFQAETKPTAFYWQKVPTPKL